MPIYLKSIDLSGFKSFPVKTHIEFVDGITGIVGPNGSGKSNVVEAVKWVLGEQSAKSMRGEKMEDIIFNGTKDRSPTGMADVQLTFSNENHWLPLDFTEVSVGRRIFRSGEGQYSINKSRVRLKDIVEMFLDTGIGKDSYAIFEQGKIDRLLSESPVERRILFEDFAGISKFKFRKEEAERKLESSRQNLERVNDIIIELEKEVERLKAQAEDANRYNELRKQLKSLEVKFEAMRVRNIRQEIDVRVEKRNAVSEKMKPLADDQKAKEDAIQATDQDIQSRESEFAAANEQMRAMEREYAELKSRISGSEERRENLAAQIASMENRLKDEEVRLGNFNEELRSKQDDLEKAKTARDEAKAEMDKIQAEIDRIFEQMKTLDASTLARSRELGYDRIVSKDDIERKRQEIIQQQAGLQNYRSSLEEKWNQFRGLEEEHKTALVQSEMIAKELTTLKNQLDAIVREIERNLQEERDIRDRNKKRGEEIKELQIQLKSMDRIIMESLEKQSAEMKVFLEKKPGLESGIESAIDELNAILSGGASGDARSAVDRLRGFFREYRSYYESILGILYSDEGAYTRKENLQKQIDELSDAIAADEQRLEELRRKLREQQNVRADVQNGYGRKEYELNNSRKEIQKLDSQMSSVQESMKNLENQINTVSEKIRDRQSLVDKLQEVVTEYEEQIRAIRENREKHNEALSNRRVDFVRVDEQYKSLVNETARIQDQIRDIERMRENFAAEKERNLKLGEELENRIAGDKKRYGELEESIAVTKTEIESRRERIEALKTQRRVLEAQVKDLFQQLAKLESSLVELEKFISEKEGVLEATVENVMKTYSIDVRQVEIGEDTDIDGIAGETTRIRRELSKLGEVNMLAIDQYQAALERMSYLQTQKSDIEAAMQDIVSIIDETNQKSIEQFVQAFEDIRKAFKKIFARLFDGGRADLLLKDPKDPLNSGIDILAEPPGTKFQSITLLSGGQRALVAISVIFAILYLKPTPFVVLDEMDAPLDDDNIERFKTLLKEFRQTSQFIVISHSKSTLEVCDALYGVTMEELGISKIINVAFDEADMLFKEEEDNN